MQATPTIYAVHVANRSNYYYVKHEIKKREVKNFYASNSSVANQLE
jgi:hypothetical protein